MKIKFCGLAVLAALLSSRPPLRAQGPADASAPNATSDGQVVKLSPFDVQADSDKSYGAANSNSITAFSTSLDKMPISADIYDQAFIRDTASLTVEQMLETYSAGAGTGNSSGSGASGAYQPGDRGGNLILRGLASSTFERDGFMQMYASNVTASTSTFDLDRAEVINGPQALLYGGGGAGGIVNLVSKQARLGTPAAGLVQFRIDQYGGKMGSFDYGAGTDRLAVRVSVLNQELSNRRTFIGGSLEGYYTQIAYQPFRNTTIRVTAEQSTFNRIENSNSKLTLAASSTSNDARNSQTIDYLLATNQIAAAAGGAPSGSGNIDNGFINWQNADSYAGWWQSELTVNEFILANVETKWTSWLSTKLDLGYNDYSDDWVHPADTLSPPNKAGNPLGVWAMSTTPVDAEMPGRTKAIRSAALATNDLFGGRAHSQSSLGIDFSRHNDQSGKINYTYYQADSNWNILVNPSVSANDGRTPMGTQYWSVDQGPTEYPLFAPRASRVTIGGVNYVRAIQNEINPSYISPSNPLGVTANSSSDYSDTNIINKGVYGVNYTNWLDGKLDTILGFRLAKYYYRTQGPGAFVGVPNAPPIVTGAVAQQSANVYGFNAGADYAVRPWLHPYFTASDSYNPPGTLSTDFYGNETKIASALGEEVGVKFNNGSNTISGSLALYHTSAKNNEFQVSSTFTNDINPSGLNGVFSAPSTYVSVAEVLQGAEAVFTAAPSNNWRLRLTAAATNGKVNTATSYGQLYNDQFYENSAGQVTYADGTVVYVPATFNSKQLTVPAGTAGAVPLTTELLSNPSSQYFAAPKAINGQITVTSDGGQVLKVVDPTHGAILTGVVGLPIAKDQLNLTEAGVVVPGTIITSTPGQPTTGYPEFSLNATGVYTIPTGFAKGLELGGSVLLGWKNRYYLYYPTGFSIGANQAMFSAPLISRFDSILAYSHKFRRVTFRTQLNVSNVFNHYDVLILPSPVTGYAGPDNATFSQQPRAYVFTNSLSF